MVGLSVVLESQQKSTKLTQVINKATINIMTNNYKPPPIPSPPFSSPSCSDYSSQINGFFPIPTFLEQCFLCGQKLLPGTDIYMYKGDRAFCSEECRYKQIFMDEEEAPNKKKGNSCSLVAATKPTPPNTASSSRAPSGSSRNKKGAPRNRVGGFAY